MIYVLLSVIRGIVQKLGRSIAKNELMDKLLKNNQRPWAGLSIEERTNGFKEHRVSV